MTNIAKDLTPLAVPIENLTPLDQNPRKGDVEAVAKSYKKFGQRKPIVARRSKSVKGGKPTGMVIAGNHQLLAAKSLGWTEIAVVFVDDDAKTAKAFALADNRTHDLGDYDNTILAELLNELTPASDLFEATGYTLADLKDILTDNERQNKKNRLKTDPDDVPEDAPSHSKRGDVWLLGPHRLMCGDSTSAADFERLMAGHKAHIVVTDPPWNVNYGVNLQKGNPQGYKPRTILNDHMDKDKWQAFVDGFVTQIRANIRPGGIIYLVMSAQEWSVVDTALQNHGFHWSSTIIWAKDRLVLSRKDYHTQYEPIWYGWANDAARLIEVEDRKQSDVWNIDRPSRSELHPTTKPVELLERMLRNSSQVGDIVLDAFGGSGSTLIAAHQTTREARLMELDPKYCDIICKRFQQATGIVPILEATGKERSFI